MLSRICLLLFGISLLACEPAQKTDRPMQDIETLAARYVRLALEIGQYDEATSNFKKTIELDPTDVYAHYSLGYVYSAASNPTEAEKYLLKMHSYIWVS